MLIKRRLDRGGLGRRNFYIASLSPDLDNKLVMPKVPENFLVQKKIGDWQMKRIGLYETVSDSLSALLEQNLEGKLVYIYEPVAFNPESLIKPSITAVPYSMVLPEWWYCKSLRLRLTKVIQVTGKEKPLEYRYGPRQTLGKLLRWTWENKKDKYGKLIVAKQAEIKNHYNYDYT